MDRFQAPPEGIQTERDQEVYRINEDHAERSQDCYSQISERYGIILQLMLYACSSL